MALRARTLRIVLTPVNCLAVQSLLSPPHIEIRRVLIESRISNLLRGGCSQIVFGGNHHQNAEGKLAAQLSEETLLYV